MKIIVICGGNSSEKEISVKSGTSVFSSIKKQYNSELLLLSNNYRIIKDKYEDGDIIFNALHGGYGENGEIQKFFELENFNFIGSGSKACQIAIDKEKCKKVASELNIRVPFGTIFNNDISVYDDFKKPFIMKPNSEGSSVGFFVINNRKDFLRALKYNEKHGNQVIIEEFIKGRELTVSILGNEALPIIEIIPKGGIYDYACKYTKGKTDYIIPARINKELDRNIKENSIKIYNKIDCRHYSRIDYILSENNIPYFLEVNTYPGMTKTSLFPKSAAKMGLQFDDLINRVISLK